MLPPAGLTPTSLAQEASAPAQPLVIEVTNNDFVTNVLRLAL
jgi:hypothetical protein